jgi:hypothetical protein
VQSKPCMILHDTDPVRPSFGLCTGRSPCRTTEREALSIDGAQPRIIRFAPKDTPSGRVSPILTLFIVAAGVVLRIWILALPIGRADADEAANGLMARHALHGELHAFFLGQRYGGSHESLIAAVLFAIVGSSVVALKLVPIALHGLAAWLAWRIGKRTVGDDAGRVGALAFWIFPAVYVWWSTKNGLFYGATLVLGLLSVLLALRLVERASYGETFALGLVIGAGIWASPQFLFFVIPVALWLAWKRGRALIEHWRRLGQFVGCFGVGLVIGAAPFLGWNLQHHWKSLEYPRGGTSHLDDLRGFLKTAFPVALGLRHPYSFQWTIPWVGRAAYLVVLALLLWTVVRKAGAAMPVSLVVVLYPFLFARTPHILFTTFEPRYVYYLMPAVLVLAGVWLQRAPVIALVILLVMSTIGIATLNNWARHHPTHYDIDSIAPRDVRPMISALERRRIKFVFAPYRYAYKLAFESREHVIATPLEGIVVRDRRLDRRVRRSTAPAYVFLANGDGDQRMRAFLQVQRRRSTRVRAGDFVVYVLAQKLLPEEVPNLQGFGIH